MKVEEFLKAANSKAKFEVQLNGIVLNKTLINTEAILNKIIVEKSNDGKYSFNLQIKNIGDKEAENIQVFAVYSIKNQFNNLGNSWKYMGLLSLENGFVEKELCQSVFISPVNIHPNNWLTCSSNRFITRENICINPSPIKIKYYSNKGVFEQYFIMAEYV